MRVAGFLAVGATILLSMTPPAVADPLTKEDFEARTVGQLRDLCAADETTEAGKYAIGFCYGYLTGTRMFYRALLDDKRTEYKPIACPAESPSRAAVSKVFVAWADANPGNDGMNSLEGLVRSVQAEWPCKS